MELSMENMENDEFKKKLDDILLRSKAEAQKHNEVYKEMNTFTYFYSEAPSPVKKELINETGYLVNTLHQIYMNQPQAIEVSVSSANSSGLFNVANHWISANHTAPEYKWSIAVITDLSRDESISDELNSLKDVLSKLWPQLVEHIPKIDKYFKVSPFDAPAAFNSIRNLYIKIKNACFNVLVVKNILTERDKESLMKILEAMLEHCGFDDNTRLINEFKQKLNDTFSKMSKDVKELAPKDEEAIKLSVLKYLKDLAVFLKALDPNRLK
jgi:hypothetical protein